MKYKLIKTYPGSPKLGYIDDLNKSGHNNQGEYVQSMYDKNPEFWEKVVEKNYKILSLARFCSIKPTITDVSDYGDEFIEAMLKCDNARIHSVKRNDGEIFTIGDKVNCHCLSKIEINNTFITSFNIVNNNVRVYDNFNEFHSLKEIKKVKQKLFTSEDGVDIFEGDNLYSIDNMLNIKKHLLFNARYDDNTLLNNRIFFNSDYKHFSTKEKAEEYVLYNKPLLTLKDIDELLCKNTSSYFLEKFKKRAQKLNNKN